MTTSPLPGNYVLVYEESTSAFALMPYTGTLFYMDTATKVRDCLDQFKLGPGTKLDGVTIVCNAIYCLDDMIPRPCHCLQHHDKEAECQQ
jgi:hypothetical protein